MVIYTELDTVGDSAYPKMYAGFPIYKEAIVRAAYGWCKAVQSPLPNTPEGALNWIAAYSQSGAGRVKMHRTIDLKSHPYTSAVEITNAVRDSSSEWAKGFRLDKPYGVGNKSLYQGEKQKYLDKADALGMIAWRSGPGTGDELIIPTGCGSYILSGDQSNYENNSCGDGKWPFQDP